MAKEIVDNAVDFLSGTEDFTLKGEKAGFNVLDLWRFQFSNLPDMEGRVGEFIVAMALKKEKPDNNNGWTYWDINYREKRIEVKTTSYYKPYRGDNNYSAVRTFGIQKAHPNEDDSAQIYTNVKKQTEKVRNNDVYVFVINTGKTKKDADPLKLESWEFYVIPTSVINEECGDHKSISLSKVKELSKKATGTEDGLSFDKVKAAVDKAIDDMNGRFTDIEGSVITKKDGTQWEFRNGKIVQIK